jgi:hypothetical protein
MFDQDTANAAELHGPKPEISCKFDGTQPELGGQGIAIDVDVRGLVRFVAEEVDAVGPRP